MAKDNLWIYGSGALAEKMFYYNQRDKLFNLLGFIDDNKGENNVFHGLPLLDYPSFKESHNPASCKLFIAIGYIKCNYYREKVFTKVTNDGYDLINYVSPNSICFEGVLKGHNIFVCDNVFIGHGSTIEDGVILSVGCTLSHENVVGRFSFISSCVAFGGHAKVKKNSFVGIHSTLRDGITIGEYNIVGASSNVLKSTEAYCISYGNPAKTKVIDTVNTSI